MTKTSYVHPPTPQFAKSQSQELHGSVRANPPGVLVRNTPAGLDADHRPFLINVDETGGATLIAHAARANSVWRDLHDGSAVLVVFRRAQGYISPNQP
ncbi:FMN-binding negative transcriptional regulator [Pseudomonas oryzihabitans]|uniref:FMN-binding negative transcriptional regulator n=1 Tax=Pseudomonas oryzihabitans TaxID=47885 RepID=UPI002B1D8C57|nr:FMN-binding negative transcriptional regulator [Pseudomonas oryzihabitans]